MSLFFRTYVSGVGKAILTYAVLNILFYFFLIAYRYITVGDFSVTKTIFFDDTNRFYLYNLGIFLVILIFFLFRARKEI